VLLKNKLRLSTENKSEIKEQGLSKTRKPVINFK
jgi:hypothetical protein